MHLWPFSPPPLPFFCGSCFCLSFRSLSPSISLCVPLSRYLPSRHPPENCSPLEFSTQTHRPMSGAASACMGNMEYGLHGHALNRRKCQTGLPRRPGGAQKTADTQHLIAQKFPSSSRTGLGSLLDPTLSSDLKVRCRIHTKAREFYKGLLVVHVYWVLREPCLTSASHASWTSRW